MDLTKLVDTSVLGGYVRALMASILATVVAKNPTLSSVLDPTLQAAIATAASTLAVGVWSHVAKKYSSP